MYTPWLRKILAIVGAVFALWLGTKYLLPVLLPFVLGTLLALAAEPAVRFGVRRFHLPRAAATGVGVGLTLIFLAGILFLLGALAVRELGVVAEALPDVRQGVIYVQDKLIGAAQRLPEGMRSFATTQVLQMMDGSGALLNQLGSGVTGAVKSVLGWLPGGALSAGTGILAGFMISARLPRLQSALGEKLPQSWRQTYLPALRRSKHSLWQWVKAQGKLMGVTYGIVALGLTMVGIRYGFFWAVLVALVDAVPILGTGTVLIPWAVVELLQGQTLRGLGIVATYGAAMLTRTVLEPRLVGRHLGLDPLLTLVFLYVGYRFWGVLGMILAPMLAAAAKGMMKQKEG